MPPKSSKWKPVGESFTVEGSASAYQTYACLCCGKEFKARVGAQAQFAKGTDPSRPWTDRMCDQGMAACDAGECVPAEATSSAEAAASSVAAAGSRAEAAASSSSGVVELEAPSTTSARKKQKAAAEPERRGVPVAGDSVEAFSVRAGWRLGVIEETSNGATIVRFENEEAILVLLPLDFESGDVRWPVQQQLHLEGRRVLVPLSVFGQEDDDDLGGYAGVIKRARGGAVVVYFPVDGKETKFAASSVGDWLLDAKDARAASEWELKVPMQPPHGWPREVLFCSLPLQEGFQANQRLLKTYCRLSECMAGVAIKQVDPGHPLSGTSHDRGLFATSNVRRGATLGSYAGVIRNAGTPRMYCDTEGAYDIHLDTSCLPCYSGDLVLDAKEVGNESRFINDYRNIAAARNVRFMTIADARKGVWVDVIATRPIIAGEEILVDYDDGGTGQENDSGSAGDGGSADHEEPRPERPRSQPSGLHPMLSPQPPRARREAGAGSSFGWLCMSCNTKNGSNVDSCAGYGADGRVCHSGRNAGLALHE